MTSFTTVFKKVYGEALEPYGFVKLKGRYPYFVKLIGDEILLVISYRNEWSSDNNRKAFNILGGVETVYRKDLALDKSPKDNTDWLNNNFTVYGQSHTYDYKTEIGKNILEFQYEIGNEEDMITAVNYSFEVTKEILLAELLTVVDLRTCLDYYRRYNGSTLNIYSEEDWSKDRTNEGLLNLKLYNPEEYAEIIDKNIGKWQKYCTYRIEHAESNRQKEAWERLKEEARGEGDKPQAVIKFENICDDPAQYKRAMNELELRKAENLKILRTYGFGV